MSASDSRWSTWTGRLLHLDSGWLQAFALIAFSLVAAVFQAELPQHMRPVVLVCYAVAIAVSSLLRLTDFAGSAAAPVSSAMVLALALSGTQPHGRHVPSATLEVLVTAAVGLLGGAVLTRVVDKEWPWIPGLIDRLVAAAIATVVYRDLPLWDGRSGADSFQAWDGQRWRSAVAMAVAGLLAAAVLVVFAVYARRGRRSFQAVFAEIGPLSIALNLAVVSTALAVALGMTALGVLAIPLMAAPLVLLRFALRQQASTSESRRQTIAALSGMTEVAGYLPPGHSRRVAELSRRIGTRMGMADRELDLLEEAARLHDIGQVSLAAPIPGGATIDIAPADQAGIADEGARIVRHTEVLDAVADILQAQVAQFRQVQELGEEVPTGSRIIKVCNAYEDLARGDAWRRDAAIERITLGIGYEYDPEVLEHLVAVTARKNAR